MLFDWISPKVVSFLILGTFEEKITKEAFSEWKSAENNKISKDPKGAQLVTASQAIRWRRQESAFVDSVMWLVYHMMWLSIIILITSHKLIRSRYMTYYVIIFSLLILNYNLFCNSLLFLWTNLKFEIDNLFNHVTCVTD